MKSVITIVYVCVCLHAYVCILMRGHSQSYDMSNNSGKNKKNIAVRVHIECLFIAPFCLLSPLNGLVSFELDNRILLQNRRLFILANCLSFSISFAPFVSLWVFRSVAFLFLFLYNSFSKHKFLP